MRHHRHSSYPTGRLRLGALLLCACAGIAQAQDGRAQREREALRRSQTLLQNTRAELETLRTEKAAAAKEKDDAIAAAQATQIGLDAARKDIAALRAELARLQAQQAAALKVQADLRSEETAAAQHQRKALESELSRQRLAREELVRLNQKLVALLEQRTAEEAELRKRNAALHALGLEAVERFRRKGTLDMALQDDPLLGLSKVRTETTAEDLQMRIDAQRSPER